MSAPSAVLLGVLAALSVLLTWFLPVARWAGSIRTLRDLIHQRYAKLATLGDGTASGACVYCGGPAGPALSDLVPRTIRVNRQCASCDVLRSIDNRVPACPACSDRVAAAGVYEVPELAAGLAPLAERRYLKTALRCLDCAGVLDRVPQERSLHAVDAALRPYL
jgi:hypothetical protein